MLYDTRRSTVQVVIEKICFSYAIVNFAWFRTMNGPRGYCACRASRESKVLPQSTSSYESGVRVCFGRVY